MSDLQTIQSPDSDNKKRNKFFIDKRLAFQRADQPRIIEDNENKNSYMSPFSIDYSDIILSPKNANTP